MTLVIKNVMSKMPSAAELERPIAMRVRTEDGVVLWERAPHYGRSMTAEDERVMELEMRLLEWMEAAHPFGAP